MNLETLLPLLAVIALATYFQTVTGFGLGMIVMGATSGFGLASIATVATVVSLISVANSACALPGRLHHIDWRIAGAASLGILPAILAGVLLLDFLSGAASNVLQFLLGVVILQGSITFSLRPATLATRSSERSFFASGFLSGLSGGLFGIAGPPLIFQFYRQPMEPAVVRNMLLLLFAVTAGTRSLFTAAQGGFDAEILTLAAFTLPLVALATLAGRRFPPALAPSTMRRVASLTLVAIGVSLVVSAVKSFAT